MQGKAFFLPFLSLSFVFSFLSVCVQATFTWRAGLITRQHHTMGYCSRSGSVGISLPPPVVWTHPPCAHAQVICSPGICPAGASSPLSEAFFATPGRPAGTEAMPSPRSTIPGEKHKHPFQESWEAGAGSFS